MKINNDLLAARELIKEQIQSLDFPQLAQWESWVNSLQNNIFELFFEEPTLVNQIDDETAELSFKGIFGINLTESKVQAALDALDAMGVKKVLMTVDSPGGTVSQAEAIRELMNGCKKKYKMVSFVPELAASAGYQVACIAPVVAQRGARLGSIGTMAKYINCAEAMKKEGIESYTFKSGKYKDLGNTARALTKEEKEKVQAMVEEAAGRFIAQVAQSRAIPEDAVRAFEADIFNAREAYAKGLVDEIGDKKKALEMLNATMSNDEKPLNPMQAIDSSASCVTLSLGTSLKDKTMTTDQLHEFEAMKAQLAEAKSTLIDSYRQQYQKAANAVCPEQKIQNLQNLSVADIKAEIALLEPMIQARFEGAKVSESTLSNGAHSQDVAASQHESKMQQELENAFLQGLMRHPSAKKMFTIPQGGLK